MQFTDFKLVVQRQFADMSQGQLFSTDVTGDDLWTTYLSSFPEGTNPVFRSRTEHDCSCCRSFIKAMGNVVAIDGENLISIWDVRVGGYYQVVADAMSKAVKAGKIHGPFFHSQSRIGVDKNHESTDAGVLTWHHFSCQLPASVRLPAEAGGSLLSTYQTTYQVFLRALQEIDVSALETVIDLVKQDLLYRGAEKLELLTAFFACKREYDRCVTDSQRSLYAWSQVTGPLKWVCRIKSDVIGTLLMDLSEGKPLEAAVASYENKVSGTNYKRPKALVTQRQRDEARKTVIELGLMAALDRRYAVAEDLKVSDLLFVNRDVRLGVNDAFSNIPIRAPQQPKPGVIEEMHIEAFIANVLPTAHSLEVLFEDSHVGNLMSLTAAADPTAPLLFKWPNQFGWSYNGDVADSVKERVKKAGGNVEGEICCRLAWYNEDDLDLHMQEPRFYIDYHSRRQRSPSGGVLDVDANGLDGIRTDPCENIYYQSISSMQPGKYSLKVHQYEKRSSDSPGFELEIEVRGTVFNFQYHSVVSQHQKIHVADIVVSADRKVTVVPVLASQARQVWGVIAGSYNKVKILTLSPNHWGGSAVGNKHYFFILNDCKNGGTARGFYNEFLRTELEPHRRAMELVGSVMHTNQADDQLSGLGFSSTMRNHLICRVSGNFTRVVKVLF